MFEIVFLGIFFYLLCCWIPAAVANTKGHPGILLFLLALFVSPIIAIVIALVLPNRNSVYVPLQAAKPAPTYGNQQPRNSHPTVLCARCNATNWAGSISCFNCASAMPPSYGARACARLRKANRAAIMTGSSHVLHERVG